MINSIYTHNEIFLRELISNASDAIDKMYFKSLTDPSITYSRDDYFVSIEADTEKRTLTISDNGIGMTSEDLENNLGIIAKSGSFAFKNENEKPEDIDIIGQFGVGFYSAFMVSKEIEVISKAYGTNETFLWKSQGADGYSISSCDDLGKISGTKIILNIKDNTENDDYDKFLQEYEIKNIIKKYSDYIRYPIKMDCEKSKLKEGTGVDGIDPEYDTEIITETLNSMTPLWRKNKNEIKSEEYNDFYKQKFFAYDEPVRVIHTKTEGSATYDALLFIPQKAPYDFYSKEYEKGLQLYTNGVLIMEKCADLLPDYFSFVKGLVDSADLSLNISREMLQHDHQLKVIAKSIEKKIKTELTKLLKDDREKYEEFFQAFGLQLKFGIYNNYGMNKEVLQDLILFKSSFENKFVTLKEYVQRMKEEQKYIYYATGESVERIESLPQTELVKDKGFEIIYLTDEVDEFAIKMLMKYNDKEFKSVSSGDLDLETKEEKEENEKQSKQSEDLFKKMKTALGDKVKEVRLSTRLKSHPVCLTSGEGLSLEMEKVLNAMPTNNEKVKAEKILEINPNHDIFTTLKEIENDDEKVAKYSEILYTQALLIEGLPIEDPVAYTNAVCDLMIK
ncbi:MAG: molecular chaperone HtpG [Oscillospiraceae bacterium]